MQKININADAPASDQGRNGQVKDINGVNGTPISFMPGFPELQDQFNQMGISHIRFHDIFGPGDIDNNVSPSALKGQLIISVPEGQKARAAQLVADFSNSRAIFPHANDGMRQHNDGLARSNANWAPTDYYLRTTMENVADLNPEYIERNVMFRVGRSNGGGSNVPADLDIYANLVGEAVRRYSADISLSGIPRKIAYWEIWNEPDLWGFWTGTSSQYYALYEKVARKIKSIDPMAKVGGCGITNGEDASGPYTRGLLSYCQRNNVPLDFLSWHYYTQRQTDPNGFARCASIQRKNLDQYGFRSAESICTEWNITPLSLSISSTTVQTVQNAAYIAASFIVMNKSSVDKAYYYRGDGGFLGLFNDENNPKDARYKAFCTYAAQAFGLYKQMFGTPQLLASPDYSSNDIYVLAGRGSNAVNVLVSNFHRDSSLAGGVHTPNNVSYRQHYVDSGRSIDVIHDDWSIEHWFGGSKPIISRAKWDDLTTPMTAELDQHRDGESAPASSMVQAVKDGIVLSVDHLPTTSPKLEIRRIADGGDLGAILPPIDNSGVKIDNIGSTITITDPLAVEYTVTHYSIIW